MSVDVEYIILMYLFICKLLSYPKCAFDELNVHCVFQTTDRKKFCSKFLSSVVTPNRINRDRIFTQKKPNLVLLCVNKLNKCRLTFFFVLRSIHIHGALFFTNGTLSIKSAHRRTETKKLSVLAPHQVYLRLSLRHRNQLCHRFVCVCVFVVFWGSSVHSMHLYVSQWKSYCSQREMQWLKNFFHFTI